MRCSRYWLTVVILLGLFVAVSYAVVAIRFAAGKGLPEYSVYSREDNGLATAADLLDRLGFQPMSVTRPIQALQRRGVLFVIAPRSQSLLGATSGLDEGDSQALLAWVKEGNTLVVATDEETALHQALGVVIGTQGEKDPGVLYQAEAAEVGGYTEPLAGAGTMPVRYIGVEKPWTVRARAGVPLWLIGGQPGAWLVPYGQGRVLILPEPSLLTHRGLLRQDNVLFLYNIARLDAVDGLVLFDEYHHGIRSGGGFWDYLRYHGLHGAALQLLAVAGIALWAVGVRLGPAVRLPRPRRADAVDYASALARIYQRAGVQGQLARHMSRDFCAAVTRYLHLPRSAGATEVLQTWRQRHGAESVRELTALVQAAESLSHRHVPERHYTRRELLHWARRFDEFVGRISSPAPRV